MNEENECMLNHIDEIYEKYFMLVEMYKSIEKELPTILAKENPQCRSKVENVIEVAKQERNALMGDFKSHFESLLSLHKKCIDSTYILERAIYDYKMECEKFDEGQN